MLNKHNSNPQPSFIAKIVSLLPEPIKPYAYLARWDKPIGTWLLLIPCWWGILFALLTNESLNPNDITYAIKLAIIFAIGAFLMRGAGCTWNDILDKNADKLVKRTASRPIASQQITPKQAFLFIILQSLCGLIILLQLPIIAIITASASLILVIIYPLCKRITYWPQAWLGLTFNWGIFIGYLSITQTSLDNIQASLPSLLLLYIAAIFWTLGYDTIYAMQDKQDDKQIGVKSLALLLDAKATPYIAAFYAIAHSLIAIAIYQYLNNWSFWAIWGVAGTQLIWQIIQLKQANNDETYGNLFKSNRNYGILIAIAMITGLI